MVASVLLGGGTRPGFMGDVVLQLVAIPALLLAMASLFPARPEQPAIAQPHDHLNKSPSRETAWAALACALVCLWPLLQLVPLPPALWLLLPDRQHMARSFELLGEPLPWWPISMVPGATWNGWLSLLAPAAVFLGTIQLGLRGRRTLSLALLGVGLLSVLLGLMQVSQGPTSALRFFDFTNAEDAVGFFANRNHYAALLYCLTLLAAAFAVDAAITTSLDNGWMKPAVLTVIGAFTVMIVLIGAQAMARSRAGLGLSILAIGGAFAFAMTDRRTASARLAFRLMAATVVLAFVFAIQFALYRVMDRFTTDPLSDWRLIFTRRTFAIAKEHILLGSGIGTFSPVYGLRERPEDLLANTYVNHAHNDIAQLLLEAGTAGALLLLCAGLWLGWQIFRVWRPASHTGSDLDRGLARSATLIVALVAVHSFVDYPLRTSAMLSVLAFALGLLVRAPLGVDPAVLPAAASAAERSSSRRRKHDEARPLPAAGAAAKVQAPATLQWPAAPAAQPEAAAAPAKPQQAKPQQAKPQQAKPQQAWPEEWLQTKGEPKKTATGSPAEGFPAKPDDPAS